MILVTSPSKTQDFSRISIEDSVFTQPIMQKEINQIVSSVKKIDRKSLAKIMDISEKLAELNFDRYQKFSAEFNSTNSKPAIFAFKGDVYSGIEIKDYKKSELEFIQKHLVILSGLYGLLKPMDLIQPYRLEMGTKIQINSYKNLYEFWGSKITNALNKSVKQTDILLNLASQEYFKALRAEELQCKVIDVVFKENKNGSYKVIGLFAKRARGKMINYIVKNKIKLLDEIKSFSLDGYKFSEDHSDKDQLVFIR